MALGGGPIVVCLLRFWFFKFWYSHDAEHLGRWLDTLRHELYKHAAWAAADAWDLERTTTQIYQSYAGLCERLGIAPAPQRRLLQAIGAMKRTTYGPLRAKGFRSGLYQFNENIIRGYVRLCASAQGLELQDLSPRDLRALAHPTVRHKRYIDPRSLGSAPSTLRRS